jgi:hypothetical protein
LEKISFRHLIFEKKEKGKSIYYLWNLAYLRETLETAVGVAKVRPLTCVDPHVLYQR